MAEEVAALSVRLEATAARFERDMQRAQRSMHRATGRMERRADRLDRRLERVGNRFGVNLNVRIIAATAAMAALGKAINDVVRNGDRLKQIEGRFRALTGSVERAEGLVSGAFSIGAETGAPLEAILESLTRFRIAGDAINATDQEVAQLTENLLKLGQIGGSTTQELTAAAIQLGQGLASGALRGEELRSVMENLPLVARQIADGLGVSVGQLREMGAEGELTAERVFGALLRGTEDVNRRFRELPITVDRAANSMATSWTRFTAEIDKSIGSSKTLAGLLDEAARRLDSFTSRLATAGDDARDLRIMELSDEIRRMETDIEGLSDVAKDLGFGDRMQRELKAAREELQKLMADAQSAAPAIDARTREILLSAGFRRGPGGRPPAGRFARGGTPGLGAVGTSPVPPPAPPDNLSFPVVGSSGAAAVDESAVRMLESLRERIELLREEQQLVGQSAVEQARLSAAFEKQRIVRELLNAAAKEGATITPEQIAQAQQLADEFERETVALVQMEEALRAKADADREAEEAAQRHAQAVQRIGDAITGAIQQADSFADALKRVALQLANIAVQGLSQPGGGFLGQLIPGLAGLLGGGAAGGGGFNFATNTGGLYAKGGAFDRSGEFTRFASGGIVTRPTVFPFANGTGLMGEAGPEAIMPLRRGPGGKLGVEASGGGGNVFYIDNSNSTAESYRELQRVLEDTVGPGRFERRAVAAVADAKQRGHPVLRGRS